MDKDTEKFILFVKNRYGIDLSSNSSLAHKHLFSDMIRTRAGSAEEYISSIINNKQAENSMLSKIVTGHTYFFRDDFHFAHTRDVLIPAVSKKYNSPVINIWCCAVSTGQEAYSLAMTLDYSLKNSRFNIFASDLSQNAVNTAKRGVYPVSALDQIPGIYQSRYCADNHDGTFSVSDKLKQHIHFGAINLMDSFAFAHKFDAVYCRNVLMYFSQDTKADVIAKLSKTMKSGGFLYTGAGENISTLPDIQLEYISSSVYRKT